MTIAWHVVGYCNAPCRENVQYMKLKWHIRAPSELVIFLGVIIKVENIK